VAREGCYERASVEVWGPLKQASRAQSGTGSQPQGVEGMARNRRRRVRPAATPQGHGALIASSHRRCSWG